MCERGSNGVHTGPAASARPRFGPCPRVPARTASHGPSTRVSRWERRVYDPNDPQKHAPNSVGNTRTTPTDFPRRYR